MSTLEAPATADRGACARRGTTRATADRGRGELSGQRTRPATLLDYYRSHDGRRLLSRQALGLAACALALCVVFGDGRLDVAIARWFFDDTRHVFPGTNHWLLKTVLHDAARTTSVVAELALLGLTVTSWVTRQLSLVRAYRRELLFASATTLIAAATVGALKHFSAHACPWDLALFGGTAIYRPLLGAPAVAQAVHGCLPAAHPLVGYAWLGVGFAIYPVARHIARRTWGVAFAFGTLFGVVQIFRGAHFLSHVLWSAWFVWGVNVALLTACVCRPARRPVSLATDSGEPRRLTAE